MAVEESELIELVRAHKCLYDTKIKEYKEFHAKRAAWRNISSKLNIPLPECKLKWNQLRNAFLHALIRRKTAKTFNKWKYEDEINFLLPFMSLSSRPRSFVSNAENDEEGDDCSETQDEDCSNRVNTPNINKKRKVDCHEKLSQTIQEERHYTDVEENENNSVCTQESYDTQKVDYHDEALKMLKEKMEKKKDEIDLLFQSLAKAVKKMPQSEQINVKVDITKIVYEAQMRCENQ